MTEKHFYLTRSEYGPNFIVAIRSYGSKREWHVYDETSPRVWYGSGVTSGSLADAKAEARAALSKTLDTALANPLTTRNVLLGLAALGALSAVFYAVVAGAAVEAVPKAIGSGTTPPLQPVPGGNQNQI